MTLATVTGLLLFGFISMFFSIAMIGALAAAGDTTPVMPKEAVLQIDFTKMTLAEQTTEMLLRALAAVILSRLAIKSALRLTSVRFVLVQNRI